MPPSGRFDRDAIDLNEDLLKPVIMHLGARVGVDVLETHLMSLYEMMALPLSSTSPAPCIDRSSCKLNVSYPCMHVRLLRAWLSNT